MSLDPKRHHEVLVAAFGDVREQLGSFVVACKSAICGGLAHDLTITPSTGSWACARGVGGPDWQSLVTVHLGAERWAALTGGEAPAKTGAHDPLDDWLEVDGQVVERKRDRRGEAFLTVRFDGLVRLVRVESTWTEDPTASTGWSEERRLTYRIAPRGERALELVTSPGAAALLKLIDAYANRAWRTFSVGARGLFVAHVERSSKPVVVETRRALGPHGDELGWLCAPRTSIRAGKIGEAATAIAPPSDLQDVQRYRLPVISDEDLRRAGAWIVERLLRCDHAEQAYTLPLLGAFLAPPLWAYVPLLDSWQRYVLWVQGPSGVGKSQLCRYFMSLWGDFVRPGLVTWLSSATYIEDVLHQVFGAPSLIGDWKRSNLTPEARAASMALIQAYADRSSRGRADARGRAQKRRPPRSALVVDGEDLPEGQQATLGRIVVLKVQGIGETGRCATADEATLDPALVALAPGVTARWIAWVQRHVELVSQDLQRGLAELEHVVVSASSNRSRVLRNYAVQIATVRSVLFFLASECGVPIDEGLMAKAIHVHADMAQAQLALVSEEAAGELFLRSLEDLLRSGVVFLRSAEGYDFESPWGSKDRSGSCVGVMEPDEVQLFASVALGAVNQHAMRTGSTKVEFSLGAVEQQLVQDGVIQVDGSRRAPGSRFRTRMWYLPYDQLGADEPRLVPKDQGDRGS